MLVVGFYNVENVTDYISIAAFHFYPSVMLQTGVLFPAIWCSLQSSQQ